VDRDPKLVILDLMERWHSQPGARRMIVESAIDDQWFSIGTIDPAAEAGLTPLAIKLAVVGARTFRVRVKPAPGAIDIPFLSGIRVLRIPGQR
jgi:hypothetical protein